MMKFSIWEQLAGRVLLLDGGMGTLIQGHGLGEKEYRGERFAAWQSPLEGCNDLLVLTAPQVISGIHESYLNVGADIISTDTFNANALSLSDYGLQEYTYEINRAAAELARGLTDRFSVKNPSKPRFVAGSMGPTSKSASISPDVNDPGARSVTFDSLVEAYLPQVRGLIDGGADMLLIETVFDTLNAKAAIRAIELAGQEKGVKLPVMISGTISDRSGRLLSGQTVEAFYTSVAHAPNLISVGLNCAMGAQQMRPYLERMGAVASCRISAHPNAGLPNLMGEYDQTPADMCASVEGFLKDGLLNIVGGCCGTTPAHIGAIAQVIHKYSPRPVPAPAHITALSGLERLEIRPEVNFVNVGERTNVAGSAKFARLIREGQMEQAVAVARDQVEAGAQIIDVCMDDGLIEGVRAMTEFLNLAASDPEVARVPVMVDSSSWDVLLAGLRCVQGKAVVNSISLKEGEAELLRRAAAIRSFGAAAVVMLFDERGQADTFERKVEVAGRAYKLLTEAGFPAEDIIFDPNVLAVATGIEEHDSYGVAFIEACRWIKQNLPHARVSGGVSNLSFSFRGNNAVREAMHSVFLYHAVAAGMDMGIVNPSMLQIYDQIPRELLDLTEDVVLNRRPDAAERLTAYASQIKDQGMAPDPAQKAWRTEGVAARIEYAMLKGIADHIAGDTAEAYASLRSPLAVIDGMLMPAMNRVGELFGQGRMFLPQVVRSARVMKQAVAVLTPYMEGGAQSGSGNGRVLIATVKGDVHDIGKNIVSVVMACNGYEILDLGVMVEAEQIVERAIEWGADVIGLSGLITPSLEEMTKVVAALQRRGVLTPVIIGGATTSALHTAVRIAPHYNGLVVHVRDASDNVRVLQRLMGDQKAFGGELRTAQGKLRDEYMRNHTNAVLRPLTEARRHGYAKQPQGVAIPCEPGRATFHDYPVADLIPYIDWRFFFPAWDIKGSYPDLLTSPEKGEQARKLFADAQQMLQTIAREGSLRMHAALGLFRASSIGDDIVVLDDKDNMALLPMLRNQTDGVEFNHCLADYLLPEQRVAGGDYIGLFVVTAGDGLEALTRRYREAGDDYNAIMCKLLADRLAEALAEAMHAYMRCKMWGFEAPGEVSPAGCIEGRYKGLRMAFGYPACPDHSLKREVFELLGAAEKLPVGLTENFMINPGESLCGMVFSDPAIEYFGVGRIGEDQMDDYAARRGMTVEQVRSLIPNNL